MKSMLQGLFDGELYPFSQYAPQSKKYKKMLEKHEEHYQDLRDKLTCMQPELVDKFESLIKNGLIIHIWKIQKCLSLVLV